MTIYCFDIDGTIFSTKGSDYPNSLPIQHRIDKVNELYQQGHEITLFTARGSTTGIDWHELTESQLERFGVRYHRLILGKPQADLYVDDKGANDKDFFSETDASQSASNDEGGYSP